MEIISILKKEDNLKVFVINLQRAQDRKKSMQQEIEKFKDKLEFIFFDAVEYMGGGD